MSDKPIYVAFASPKLEKNFAKLKEGKFTEVPTDIYVLSF
jgi:hypothetical protein